MSNNHIFVQKLRSSGLRPTKQRIEICKFLFDRKNTFHFTISYLNNVLRKNLREKISLATIYNTIYAFKKKGHLKEILINRDKSYFDTNISSHHHFFNESTNEIIDLKDDEVSPISVKKKIPGKKIKSVEVLVKITNNS